MTFSTKVLCSLAMLLVPYQVDARKLEFRMADFGIRSTKLLQKSEMRKEIVIELSYKGFSRASDYS